jgi:parallel beta-helix repeat protein
MADPLNRRDARWLSLASAGSVAAAEAPPALPAAQAVVSVTSFGARGDGVSDDTAAFQKALNTGSDVLVPATLQHYRVSLTLGTTRQGQRIFGQGERSHIVQLGVNANATVLAVVHEDVTVANLRLTPNAQSSNLGEGWGVAISATRGCTVERCRFDGMRRGGVLVNDSSECVVRDSLFRASIVRADWRARQAEMGYDVLMAGTSSRNVVSGNQCLSGCGTGIGCQTVTEGKSQFANVVRGNIVRGHPCYGIMAYTSGTKGIVAGIIIAGNLIEEISGAVATEAGTAFYGAGIYVQTANDFLIEGNHIRATNTDRRVARSGNDVPAAIAVSGCGNGVIGNNVIRDCLDGIASIQTTRPIPEGEGTVITGNVVIDCDRFGINLSDCAAATVSNNRLTGRGPKTTHGVYITRTSPGAALRDFIIDSNVIRGFYAGIGVEGVAIQRASVIGNTVLDSAGYAISSTAATTIVSSNIVRGAFGISLGKTAQNGWCTGNVVETSNLALIDDSGGQVTVADNILPTAPGKVSTGLALPQVTGKPNHKRWRSLAAGALLSDLGPGYEGQQTSILAEGGAKLIDGRIILRGRASRNLAKDELVSFVFLNDRWRETG